MFQTSQRRFCTGSTFYSSRSNTRSAQWSCDWHRTVSLEFQDALPPIPSPCPYPAPYPSLVSEYSRIVHHSLDESRFGFRTQEADSRATLDILSSPPPNLPITPAQCGEGKGPFTYPALTFSCLPSLCHGQESGRSMYEGRQLWMDRLLESHSPPSCSFHPHNR